MTESISKSAREELIETLMHRYRKGSKTEKTRILDEFVQISNLHRKHAIRLLAKGPTESGRSKGSPLVDRRIYGEAIQQTLVVLWEASDRICSKRLKAAIPALVGALERNGHLSLDPSVRAGVLSVSAATIDRLLASKRGQANPAKRRLRRPTKPARKVPVKTFTEWDECLPGELEIDMVAHCGGNMSGPFIHSLVATDVSSGWVEAVPLLAREQSVVVEGLKVIGKRFPVPICAINSDNDSAFINDTLISYCTEQNIRFTRSRAYQKNDQAWIEQKNGAVVRGLMGYDRYSGIVAGQAMAKVYALSRLYVNFFQPSFKLREKTRVGARVRKTYHAPTTPFEKLMENTHTTDTAKIHMQGVFEQLDPLELLHQIRQTQTALAALGSETPVNDSARESTEQFLSGLAELWRQGEARPTHSPKTRPARHWRTRDDPFAGVWTEVLTWLQAEPETDANIIFKRLQEKYPGTYSDGQLRTLQRRIKDWRKVLARSFVFEDTPDTTEPISVCDRNNEKTTVTS